MTRGWSSTQRRMRTVGLAAILAFAGGAFDVHVHAAPSPSSERTARVVRGRHSRGRYPDDLLVNPPPDANGRVRGRAPIPLFGNRRAPGLEAEPDGPFPEFELPGWLKRFLESVGRVLGPFAKILTYVAVAALALFFLYLLTRLRKPSFAKRSKPERGGSSGAVPEEATQDPLLALPELPHEELARLGRYREAIHALFVLSLHETGFEPVGRGRSATAREVVDRFEDPLRKPPLRDLLSLTERYWFGGRNADAESYETARALHARFHEGVVS